MSEETKDGPADEDEDLDFAAPARPGWKPLEGPAPRPMSWPPPLPAPENIVPEALRLERESARAEALAERARMPGFGDRPLWQKAGIIVIAPFLLLLGALGWLWDVVTYPIWVPYVAIRTAIRKRRGTYTGTDWRRPWK